MADDSGIDPRYAAQFQRGFDPTRHPVEDAAHRETPPRPDAPVRLPGGPVPTAERIAPGPRLVAPAPVEQPVAAPAVAPTNADPEELDLDEPAPSPRLDWVLLGVGVLLVILAAATFWTAATDRSPYTGNISQEGYMLLQMRNALPGPLLVAGIAAVSAWVVARALRPSRAS